MPCLPILSSFSLFLEALGFPFVSVGIEKLNSAAAGQTGDMLHEVASQSLLLVAYYCCYRRCSKELHLGCLMLWLQAFLWDHYPSSQRIPVFRSCRVPQQTQFCVTTGVNLLLTTAAPSTVLMSSTLPLTPVRDKSGSQCNTQLGVQFSYLLFIFILHGMLTYHNSYSEKFMYDTEFNYTRLGLIATPGPHAPKECA